MIFQKGGLNGYHDAQYWLRLNDDWGKVNFLTGDGDVPSSYIFTQTSITDGQWHHIVAKRIGEVMSLYLDGERVLREGKTIKNTNNNQSLKVGAQIRYTHGVINTFKGDMSALYLYKRALNEREILHLMESTRPNKKYNPCSFIKEDITPIGG